MKNKRLKHDYLISNHLYITCQTPSVKKTTYFIKRRVIFRLKMKEKKFENQE